MAEEKAKQFMQNHAQDADAYKNNFSAHKPGITMCESTNVYNNWATYENDLNREHYKGPVIAAQAVSEFFPKNKEDYLIIDVAAGTGFVGEELQKLGFKKMHALEPSIALMEMAREYDCAVIAGGMGEGHIPTEGLHELARIVKPGGLVCIVMREEYLQHVAEYRGRLENTMKEMEKKGVWKLASRVTVPRYSFNNNGVIFKFVVC
ncbi:hypothetical protein ACOMHN_029956 [Nucella lapillus]